METSSISLKKKLLKKSYDRISVASNPNVLDFPFYWYTRLLCFHSEKSLLVEQQLVVTYFSVLFSWSC